MTRERNGREAKPEKRDKKVTTKSLRLMKQAGKRIVALTAYDYLMAELLDQAGVDLILAGDSAAMAVQGRHTTVSVTMEEMLYHAELVSSAVERALVVGDLPFMSYQINADEALRNAGRMVQEAHVEAVKLEGGQSLCTTIRRIVEAGIPVMGHLGLTPQSIHKFGTYQVRATEPEEADEVRRDAQALEDPLALFAATSHVLLRPVLQLDELGLRLLPASGEHEHHGSESTGDPRLHVFPQYDSRSLGKSPPRTSLA